MLPKLVLVQAAEKLPYYDAKTRPEAPPRTLPIRHRHKESTLGKKR